VPPKPVQTERTYKEVQAPKYEPMHVVEETWMQKWWRNNPDMEKFIGENLINKIGIAVLVLGISFFVKYAIDKNWINEVGRVCIGLFCGMLLTGVAHYLRHSYRSLVLYWPVAELLFFILLLPMPFISITCFRKRLLL
jgi:uncharacterized membrane protein